MLTLVPKEPLDPAGIDDSPIERATLEPTADEPPPSWIDANILPASALQRQEARLADPHEIGLRSRFGDGAEPCQGAGGSGHGS